MASDLGFAPLSDSQDFQQSLSMHQQPGSLDTANLQAPPPVGDNAGSDHAPSPITKEQLTVISEATEPSNGVCVGVVSSQGSLSPGGRRLSTKSGGSHHSDGRRSRLGSRTSVSMGGSPRPSISHRPSIATETLADGNKPNDYLVWAILACLCPVWPINIVGLTFSVMSRNSLQQGNVDGARRLGRNAKILSIVSFVGGIIIIATAIAVNI